MLLIYDAIAYYSLLKCCGSIQHPPAIVQLHAPSRVSMLDAPMSPPSQTEAGESIIYSRKIASKARKPSVVDLSSQATVLSGHGGE